MDLHRFNALARTLAPSRRTTLAIQPATAREFPGRARGKGKKKGPACKKSAEQRCTGDVEMCRAMYMGRCQDPPEYCLSIAVCCDTCSANGMLTCLLELQESTTAAQIAARLTGTRDA